MINMISDFCFSFSYRTLVYTFYHQTHVLLPVLNEAGSVFLMNLPFVLTLLPTPQFWNLAFMSMDQIPRFKLQYLCL